MGKIVQPFKVGEVVYLNSGSPKLTVIEVFEDDTIEVGWLSENVAQTFAGPSVCFKREQ